LRGGPFRRSKNGSHQTEMAQRQAASAALMQCCPTANDQLSMRQVVGRSLRATRADLPSMLRVTRRLVAESSRATELARSDPAIGRVRARLPLDSHGPPDQASHGSPERQLRCPALRTGRCVNPSAEAPESGASAPLLGRASSLGWPLSFPRLRHRVGARVPPHVRAGRLTLLAVPGTGTTGQD
jgi:hypothetical protein